MKYTVFDKSTVMKIIAKTDSSLYMQHQEVKEVFTAFESVPDSYFNTILGLIRNNNTGFKLLYSLYTLGVIHGIRQERKRRRERKNEKSQECTKSD